MTSGGPTGDEAPLRATEAQRREITAALDYAYADGQLGREEYDERTQIATSARYVDDLRGLLFDLQGVEVDLPARRATPPARREPASSSPGTPDPDDRQSADLATAPSTELDVPGQWSTPKIMATFVGVVALVVVLVVVLSAL